MQGTLHGLICWFWLELPAATGTTLIDDATAESVNHDDDATTARTCRPDEIGTAITTYVANIVTTALQRTGNLAGPSVSRRP